MFAMFLFVFFCNLVAFDLGTATVEQEDVFSIVRRLQRPEVSGEYEVMYIRSKLIHDTTRMSKARQRTDKDLEYVKAMVAFQVRREMKQQEERLRRIEASVENVANQTRLISDGLRFHHRRPQNSAKRACPSGFDYLPEIDQCLRLNLEPMTWKKAREACSRVRKGVQLVMITDSIKQEAVKRYLQQQFPKSESEVCVYSPWPAGKTAWLGGQTKDPNRCGTPYVWKPLGTVEIPFNYTNWKSTAPDCTERGETCALISSETVHYDYRWEDAPCNWSLCSVCEF